MLKLTDNKLTMQRERKLTAKQLSALKRMNAPCQQQYLLSLVGIKQDLNRWADTHTKVSGRDELARKPAGTVLQELTDVVRNCRLKHTPNAKTSGRNWIGVEIECFVNCSNAALIAKLKGAQCSRTTVQADGSLSDDSEANAVEVTCLFNLDHGFEPLRRLCDVLTDCEAFVNDTCGLHVHLDMRGRTGRDVRKIGNRLGRALPVLQHMVPKSRRDNSYCKVAVSQFRGCRYFAVNLTAFRKYRTIEVRLHGGTTSFSKISSWIELLKHLSRAQVTAPMASFQDLLDAGIPDRLIPYVTKRIEKFSPDFLAAPVLPAQTVSPAVSQRLNYLLQAERAAEAEALDAQALQATGTDSAAGVSNV